MGEEEENGADKGGEEVPWTILSLIPNKVNSTENEKDPLFSSFFLKIIFKKRLKIELEKGNSKERE